MTKQKSINEIYMTTQVPGAPQEGPAAAQEPAGEGQGPAGGQGPAAPQGGGAQVDDRITFFR